MNTSAAIADPLLRQAFGRRARPSEEQRDRHRHRRRSQSPRLRAPVSVPHHPSHISMGEGEGGGRTVMNNAGLRRQKTYRNTIFTSPTQLRYRTSEPIMAGQKPKRGTPAIMATT